MTWQDAMLCDVHCHSWLLLMSLHDAASGSIPSPRSLTPPLLREPERKAYGGMHDSVSGSAADADPGRSEPLSRWLSLLLCQGYRSAQDSSMANGSNRLALSCMHTPVLAQSCWLTIPPQAETCFDASSDSVFGWLVYTSTASQAQCRRGFGEPFSPSVYLLSGPSAVCISGKAPWLGGFVGGLRTISTIISSTQEDIVTLTKP